MPDKEEVNGTLLKIENAMLKNTAEIKEHFDKKIDDLPIQEHHDAIKKNANNHRTLVIVLAVTGVLGGGGIGLGAAKVISLLTGAG